MTNKSCYYIILGLFMIIDVYKLRLIGKEEESFKFDFFPNRALLSIPEAEFSAPAQADILVEVYPEEVYISGVLTYKISAPCSRCLKNTESFRSIEFDERFLPSQRADEEEDSALVYERDKIDLTPYFNELILTDLPLSILCKENCKGLCPVCGQDLNAGDCGHHIE